MRQLSGHDASFLYADTQHSNANVTFVQIYDQSTAPGGVVRFKSILAHIQSRLPRTPMFRSKLLRVPLELDRPYWVEDEHFDLEYHVRHIALPKPGDWRQFCIQASRIHARALDRHRPLWEIYVIEGLDSVAELPPGSFALLTKVHHAAFDLGEVNPLVAALHDANPVPPPAEPAAPWFPERAPSALGLMAKGIVHTMFAPWRLVEPLTRLAPAARAFASDLLRPDHHAATRFHSVVSPHRVFDTRRFLLDEVERIRRLVPGASVDDAVTAVCAGGLRRYLDAHGELPAADLSAIVPTERGETRRVPLGTDIADPVERLAHIHRQTSATTARPERRRSLPTFSITNVPLPDGPLFLTGARLTFFSAILPITDGMGLAFAVTRHDGRVIVSPTSCRELMPDPQAFTQCVRDSFQEYLALAPGSAGPRSAGPRGSGPRRRSPAGPKAGRAATAPRAGRGDRRRSTAPAH
jgi:WS/DGAT/MGAT family acyltransferase